MDRGYYSLETLSLLLTLKAKCVDSGRRASRRIERGADSYNAQVPGSDNLAAREPRVATDHAGVRLLRCVACSISACRGRTLMHSCELDECQQKYGNANVWKACCAVFDYLNLAAVRSVTLIFAGSLLTQHPADHRRLDPLRAWWTLTRATDTRSDQSDRAGPGDSSRGRVLRQVSPH